MRERRPDLDAVLAASDVMASGALQVPREAGRSVPGDVALIGYDDSVVARHTDPPRTSVRQPIVEMGRTMARLLLDEIAEPARLRRQVVLPPNWWDGVRVALGRCRPCRLIPRLAMTAR